VATSLFYGIETETVRFPAREASALDDAALQSLYPLIDRDIIADQERTSARHPSLRRCCKPCQSSFIYDKLLIRLDQRPAEPGTVRPSASISWSATKASSGAICAGVYNDQMICRSATNSPRAQAGEILRQIVQKMDGRAADTTDAPGGFHSAAQHRLERGRAVQSEFRRRVLKVLQIEETRGRRLCRAARCCGIYNSRLSSFFV